MEEQQISNPDATPKPDLMAVHLRQERVDQRLDDGDRRMNELAESLAENTASTKRVENNTEDLVAAFRNAQSAFKVLAWIGKVAKPIWYIASAVTAVWGAVMVAKSGVGPK